jgi:hypothetical protein
VPPSSAWGKAPPCALDGQYGASGQASRAIAESVSSNSRARQRSRGAPHIAACCSPSLLPHSTASDGRPASLPSAWRASSVTEPRNEASSSG